MSDWQLTVPVALFIFKRPHTTERVFEEIRKAKPPKLFVIADGPREDKQGEAKECTDTRAIIDRVDWECEVLTNYSDINMGGKRRVPSGLDWVFDNIEEAIILEDDCLPHSTFFRYCQELLERYRDDKRIMVISGDNFQFGRSRTEYSYYFSRYPHCWGWATWRRAWKHYNFNLELWSEIRDGGWLHDWLGDKNAIRYWTKIFDNIYKGKIDHWDYRWTYACWIQSALTVLPNVNLVSNIGFGESATNTKGQSKFACMKTEAMRFPLRHPPFVIRDTQADDFTQKNHFGPPNLIARVKSKARTLVTNLQAKVGT